VGDVLKFTEQKITQCLVHADHEGIITLQLHYIT